MYTVSFNNDGQGGGEKTLHEVKNRICEIFGSRPISPPLSNFSAMPMTERITESWRPTFKFEKALNEEEITCSMVGTCILLVVKGLDKALITVYKFRLPFLVDYEVWVKIIRKMTINNQFIYKMTKKRYMIQSVSRTTYILDVLCKSHVSTQMGRFDWYHGHTEKPFNALTEWLSTWSR